MEISLARDEGSPHRLVIDRDRQLALADDQPLALLPTEFRILQLLATAPGRIFRRQEILDGINDQNYAVTERAVDVQITHLRKKLGSLASCIETIRGQGSASTTAQSQSDAGGRVPNRRRGVTTLRGMVFADRPAPVEDSRAKGNAAVKYPACSSLFDGVPSHITEGVPLR